MTNPPDTGNMGMPDNLPGHPESAAISIKNIHKKVTDFDNFS